jgi:hypothetical protein
MPSVPVFKQFLSRVDRLLNGDGGLLSLLAVALGRISMFLRPIVLTLLVVVSRFHVVMGRHLVVRGRCEVVLDCLGLSVGSHGLLLR